MKHFYLIKVKYLGFRYHGWAHQPGVKTVQGMIEKTIRFVLPDQKIKTLGSGRTDAMVSANGAFFELFLNQKIDERQFMEDFNLNLPQDIKALSIKEVDSNFNIIQSVKQKEYRYYFQWGEKADPFYAPFAFSYPGSLDIEKMQKAALLFQGQHEFVQYCYMPNEKVDTVRTIASCRIEKPDVNSHEYVPKDAYCLIVKGTGFMRKQIRLIMGALFLLGRNEISEVQLKRSLEGHKEFNQYVASASGLVLEGVEFE